MLIHIKIIAVPKCLAKLLFSKSNFDAIYSTKMPNLYDPHNQTNPLISLTIFSSDVNHLIYSDKYSNIRLLYEYSNIQ